MKFKSPLLIIISASSLEKTIKVKDCGSYSLRNLEYQCIIVRIQLLQLLERTSSHLAAETLPCQATIQL